MPTPPPDDHSLAAWHQAHRGIFGKVARSFARGEAETAELEQEMLFQLWQSLPRFAGQAKRSTWVYRVCLNTALTWRRGVDRRERRIEIGHDLELLPVTGGSPAEAAERNERLDELYAALQTLTATERALVLLMLDGLAYREIADITGLTENHIGVALTRARRRLAERMKGGDDELG